MRDYEIRKGVPIPPPKRTGLTDTIRAMDQWDCIDIPSSQAFSVHACAAHVGAKVTTRKNEDGTVTVWRIDETKPSQNPRPPVNLFGPDEDTGPVAAGPGSDVGEDILS